MSKKYKTTVTMESVLLPDGTRKKFNPGDMIDEKYITSSSIDQYVKGGLLVPEEKVNSGRPNASRSDSEKTD